MTYMESKPTQIQVAAVAFLLCLASMSRSQEPQQPKSVQFSDAPLFDDEGERMPSVITRPTENIEHIIEFDRNDPLQLAAEIAEEMQTNQLEESSQMEAIREGLKVLQNRNQLLEKLSLERNNELEATKQLAAQAKRMAEDARRDAERSNNVTMEAMRQLLAIQNEVKRPPRTLPPTPHVATSPTLVMEPSPPATESETTDSTPLISEPRTDSASPPTSVANPPQIGAVPIMDEAIDREKFADNLFGAGEFETAVAIYVELIKNPPEESEVNWFLYQAASCYRNLGDLDRAENLYRKVAADKDALISSTARWWLSMIEDQRMVYQTIEKLNRVFPEDAAYEK